MHTLFGVRIGNAMMRNGMYSIDDFIEHCQKYPHGIYSNQPYWYRIGRKSYDKIVAIIDRELTRFLQEKIIEDQIITPCCPGCKHAANNICHKNHCFAYKFFRLFNKKYFVPTKGEVNES